MSADPNEQPILEIHDLVTRFYTDEGTVGAVDGSPFGLYGGETLGIVGESGSGGSVITLSMLQPVNSPGRVERGSVRYHDDDLLEKSEAKMQSIRGNDIAMIFQDLMTNLNPMFTAGDQTSWVIKTRQDVSDAAARERTIELIASVGIPEPTSRVGNYPHQFLSGMRQHVLLAMVISCELDAFIVDEPTMTFDTTVETQMFNVPDELQEKYRMSIILITHDLGVVVGTCDRVVIAYGDHAVERAGVGDLFEDPRHPYTRDLMRSILRLTGDTDWLAPVEGDVPNLTDLPSGCSFHPRRPHVIAECESYDPRLREVGPG